MKWFGGKGHLAKELHRYLPQHKCFVDLFGGGGNMTSMKEPSDVEIFNDIDGDLVNFLLVLRGDPEKLAQAVATLPYSEELFEKWKWQKGRKSNFERAVCFFYLNRLAVSAGNNHRSGWSHGGTKANKAREYQSAVVRLEAFAKRFQQVEIHNRDYKDVIRLRDSEDTVFYIDPPYNGRERRYKGGFRRRDHIELAEILRQIKGKAMVSYYPHPLVDELYKNWPRRIEIGSHTFSQVSREEERPKRTELLFLSWEDPQANIFDWVGN
nr:DNA adenine methylase [Tumebacillus amylolyticus]